MKKYTFLLSLFVLLTCFAKAQRISDTSFEQDGDMLVITYNISSIGDDRIADVKLFVSTDGGRSFSGPLFYVTGDVGKVETDGRKTINWYVFDEYDSLSGIIVFEVRAEIIRKVVIHNGTEVVAVTNPRTGRTWMDRNLGASRVATSSTDAQAYGDLYQWGRAADGHQKRTSGTTSTRISSNTPGHGNFILAPNRPYDWRSPQNDDLWQGVNDTNNPCPAGFRLPTEAEWKAERRSWSYRNANGAFNSHLKLPLAGLRDGSSGSLYKVGLGGYYWSSTVTRTGSRRSYFHSSNAIRPSHNRASGYSIRCIKD